jgi:HAD superfamily hydrolase (TIGR01509 family)
MAVKALIFDVDGTLAITERDGHRPAYNAAFAAARLGWHWDVELYQSLLSIAGGKERIRHYAAEHDPAFLEQPDAAERIVEVYADKTRHYLAAVNDGAIPLRPGVERLIGEARAAGVRLAVSTTTNPQNVTALLTSRMGPDAADWFEVIGAGDVVAHKKPAPDIYRWVLERLDLPAGQCLAVEDSAIGLRAARAAGIPTVVTPSPETQGQDTTGALVVMPDLGGTSLAELMDIHERATGGQAEPSASTDVPVS